MRRLSTAYWQLIEIAKALTEDTRVLIMDEPTASLASNEVERLFELIGRLRDDGISIVYISHRLEEISQVADRVIDPARRRRWSRRRTSPTSPSTGSSST